jgi:hypothetical protein
MNTDTSPAKPERSYTLVIVAAFVIATLMPVVRTIATGDTEVAAAYSTTASVSADTGSLRDRAGDKVSLLVVGAFLLGLGSVLRRVA